MHKKVNSVQVKLNMQRKADVTVIDQAKLKNRNWREVKICWNSVTRRLAHEDRPYPFYVPDKEVSVNVANLRRMRKRDPFRVFFQDLLGRTEGRL